MGFRPFVYNLAKSLHLRGAVKNTAAGVFIELLAEEEIVKEFVSVLKRERPPKSIIQDISIQAVTLSESSDFRIVESEESKVPDIKISPDFALCNACKSELQSAADRRYSYPFITCSECGPRYSILEGLPYDRQETTMQDFSMCTECAEEYGSPSDRRFFSQTNSCPSCGVKMTLLDSAGIPIVKPQEELIPQAVSFLKSGAIVAVKGIGGFLLLCDASNPEAIQKLRERKARPEKPFALLYPNLAALKRDAFVSASEAELLKSEVSPIVLLRRRRYKKNEVAWEGVTPRLSTVGAMLPYAPLLQLLSDGFGGALIATSGNTSGGPIIFQDEEAKTELLQFADYVLTNNRKICTPQDDSVAKVVGDEPVWLRRSRGLAPSYFGPLPNKLEDGLLALGAHMKGSFALTQGPSIHVSQFLGALSSFEAQETYRNTLQHFQMLLKNKPQKVLTDNHPGYFVHELGLELQNAVRVEVETMQHHKAHFAAVLQENDLTEDQGVMGVIWDGTGLGDDHQIWGGEFFTYSNYKMKRELHLDYVPVLAHDKMAEQPRLSALSFGTDVAHIQELIEKKFSEIEWYNYQRRLINAEVQTSSMGRLFDAIASIIGLNDVSTYEGQAAMLLEECASEHQGPFNELYVLPVGSSISTKELITAVLQDVKKGYLPSFIAMKFHLSLVDLIRRAANQLNLSKIAFSGGVFQNGLLVCLIKRYLAADYQLYFHKELPPNDENISFGQIALYHLQQKQRAALNNKNYVSSNSW